MIFSSEQPQTGMNEGTWFTQGMCINKMKVRYHGVIAGGQGKKKATRGLPFVCFTLSIRNSIF